jgi:hypothetical protein
MLLEESRFSSSSLPLPRLERIEVRLNIGTTKNLVGKIHGI